MSIADCSNRACLVCGELPSAPSQRCRGCRCWVHGKCSSPKFYDNESVRTFWCSRACKNYRTPPERTKEEIEENPAYSDIAALRRFADEFGLRVLAGLRGAGQRKPADYDTKYALPFLTAYWVETGTLRLHVGGRDYVIQEKQLIAVNENIVNYILDDTGCTYAVARAATKKPEIMQLVFDATTKLHAKEARALQDSLRELDASQDLVASLRRDLDKATEHIARVADLKSALHKAVDLLPDAPVELPPSSEEDGEPAAFPS